MLKRRNEGRKVKSKEKNTSYNLSVQVKNTTAGITLVALVVTVIILIILATISISAVLGENGIVKKSQLAKSQTENRIEKEQGELNETVQEYTNIMNKGSSVPIPKDSCIYVKLYSDGTLVFSKEKDYIDVSRGDYIDYGNIREDRYTSENLPKWSEKPVKSVIVNDEISPLDTSYWFYHESQENTLTSIDISKLDTSETTRMEKMFWNCTGITELDVSHFYTRNVTTMEGMFFRCNKLSSLNVSNFDTSNVTNMQDMFIRCERLSILDVRSFDTSNVTNMSGMFAACSNLTNLDLSGFNTEKVTSMEQMFYEGTAMTYYDLSSFDVRNVTNFNTMFLRVQSNAVLDLSSFDINENVDFNNMFGDGSSYHFTGSTIYVKNENMLNRMKTAAKSGNIIIKE